MVETIEHSACDLQRQDASEYCSEPVFLLTFNKNAVLSFRKHKLATKPH